MKVESEMLQIEHNILKSKNRFLSEKLKDLGAGKWFFVFTCSSVQLISYA